MATTANFFVTKTQAAFAGSGKWTTKVIWDKIGHTKKVIKETYSKVFGKQKVQVEELTPQIESLCSHKVAGLRIHLPLQSFRSTLAGHASRIYHRAFARARLEHGKGMSRDYLWRKMHTGHLIGFGTLFLVREEEALEEIRSMKRWDEYDQLCRNIGTTFTANCVSKMRECLPASKGNVLSDYELGNCIAVGSNGAVYEAELVEKLFENSLSIEQCDGMYDEINESSPLLSKQSKLGKSPKLAIKMVFNPESSNTNIIWRKTDAEMVTCGRGVISSLAKDWQNGNRARKKTLTYHPNIVTIERAFVDQIPLLPNFCAKHPAFMPAPCGYGRSRTMFIVMKRYERTLEEYLDETNPDLRVRQLLALQLLQAVAHLEKSKVAHRDIKSDNILIEFDSVGIPRLVLSDFGCCLVSENSEELVYPFPSFNCDFRDGNASVQPPEISECTPGPDSHFDYRKSDAWAAGIVLCKILGFKNLYEGETKESFKVVKKIVDLLMKSQVNKRISCRLASDVLYLDMFGPKIPDDVSPIQSELSDWLLLHSAETMAYKGMASWGKDSVVCDMFTNFLSSVSCSDLLEAVGKWLLLRKYVDG